MKKLLFYLLAPLCFAIAAPSVGEDIIKNGDTLEKELKPLVKEALTMSGIQGRNEHNLYQVALYINENALAVYKEIDYLDDLVTAWQKAQNPDAGKNESSYYPSIFDVEEDRTSLLCFIFRRDDTYFDIINDLAKKLNLNDKRSLNKFLQLADPGFFLHNKEQDKVRDLGKRLFDTGKNDVVFKTMIQSWFPETKITIRMPRSGTPYQHYSMDPPQQAYDIQSKKIAQFSQEWKQLMQQIPESKSQEEINACAKKMESMAYPLLEILALRPPEDDRLEAALAKQFMDEIYIPLSSIGIDISQFSGENTKRNPAAEHLTVLSEKKEINTVALRKCWKTLLQAANGDNGVEYSSYLREYVSETSANILYSFYANGG